MRDPRDYTRLQLFDAAGKARMPNLHTRLVQMGSELLILKTLWFWRGDCYKLDVTKFSQAFGETIESAFNPPNQSPRQNPSL